MGVTGGTAGTGVFVPGMHMRGNETARPSLDASPATILLCRTNQAIGGLPSSSAEGIPGPPQGKTQPGNRAFLGFHPQQP